MINYSIKSVNWKVWSYSDHLKDHKIEGESEFKESSRFAGININAAGSNIITLGDGNIVNTKFESLHSELTKLQKIIAKSTLSEEERISALVDIETLKDQLVTPLPDKSIIRLIWSKIEKVSNLIGIADNLAKITPLISQLIQ